MTLKTTLWDPSEFLDSPASIAAYLEAAFEDGDPSPHCCRSRRYRARHRHDANGLPSRSHPRGPLQSTLADGYSENASGAVSLVKNLLAGA